MTKTQQIIELIWEIGNSVPKHIKADSEQTYTSAECGEIWELAENSAYVVKSINLLEESLNFLENFKLKETK